MTCLTPTLVGDGRKLSPIDYMVWKDQVNVLDQTRIFKLLAKGPRLDSYLAQLRKADKLDFASWGGFAQNFADRRIPFEHPSLTGFWNNQRAEGLFIPTFCAGSNGPYLPGSAIRGALHTALMFSRWSEYTLRQISDKCQGERLPRFPAESAEESAIGTEGLSRMRPFGVADSAPVDHSNMKIFLVRTSTLVARGGRTELGWKQSPRGSVEARRMDESTPVFCEMADAGTRFEGDWFERKFLSQPEVLRMLRWREATAIKDLASAANASAGKLLGLHRQYAANAGLRLLDQNLDSLEKELAETRERPGACLLCLGWGGGFLSKSANMNTDDDNYRKLLRLFPYYARAIQTGLPFPKTRRIVFLGGLPALMPGWVRVQFDLS
ncbi:MAG: type III-A CRISPR-associated RAMP protein Csm5 [Bryobacterales bacterium]|nr:type III-A CRISPR-associated RAMP protein Csm5 [Bryobacterales bacterium]